MKWGWQAPGVQRAAGTEDVALSQAPARDTLSRDALRCFSPSSSSLEPLAYSPEPRACGGFLRRAGGPALVGSPSTLLPPARDLGCLERRVGTKVPGTLALRTGLLCPGWNSATQSAAATFIVGVPPFKVATLGFKVRRPPPCQDPRIRSWPRGASGRALPCVTEAGVGGGPLMLRLGSGVRVRELVPRIRILAVPSGCRRWGLRSCPLLRLPGEARASCGHWASPSLPLAAVPEDETTEGSQASRRPAGLCLPFRQLRVPRVGAHSSLRPTKDPGAAAACADRLPGAGGRAALPTVGAWVRSPLSPRDARAGVKGEPGACGHGRGPCGWHSAGKRKGCGSLWSRQMHRRCQLRELHRSSNSVHNVPPASSRGWGLARARAASFCWHRAQTHAVRPRLCRPLSFPGPSLPGTV